MFKLLNRFAWFISIWIWFILLFLFWIAVGSMDSRNNVLDEDFFFIWIIFLIIFWIIFKKIFLSKSFIEERVRFFANSLNKNYLWKNIFQKENNKKENIKEYVKNIPEKMKEKMKEKITKIEPWIISKFFSENILAKLWGILVFLWVLFFLSLIYNEVWPVAKIIIWFAVWFGLYFSWVLLNNKWLEQEWKILLWVWILVNYLVILSGRYLLWNDWHLSETTTFVFLILNTIFAVLTSIIYKSKVLLIFSFIFAYLNPLLIWASSNNPYTLLWYTLIISLWAFFISYKQKNLVLLILSFLLWNFLILISPISNSTDWISVIIVLNIFNIIAISSWINFKDKYKTILEFIFGWSFFAIALFGLIYNNYLLNSTEFLIAIMSSLLFLLFSYLLSYKATYLYSIWTTGWILTLAPLIALSIYYEKFIDISVFAIIIFAILNWIVPFINKSFLDDKKITNLFIWSIFWAIFLWINIYLFWEKYFPWVMEWFAFLGLAIIYLIQWLIFIQNIWIEKVKEKQNYKNIFYNFVWITVWLFSIAIAFVFSKYPEIISTIWLFESTLLFYFFNKTKSFKLYLIAIVLFIIWIIKFWTLLNVVDKWDYSFLVSFIIILASFILNIKFLNKTSTEIQQNKNDSNYEIFHSIFHIVWIWILWFLLLLIIPSTWHWWSILWISIFIMILWFVYSKFSCKFLKWFFIILITLFMFFQIEQLYYIFYTLEIQNIEYLKVLQYISTIILAFTLLIWNKFNKNKFWNILLYTISSIYLLIITSFYIYDIFNNTFTITIYWWIISSIFLFYWIAKNIIKYRTLWLYLVSLTALKIFLYDIWYGIDDAIVRVIALIIIWILFIIISTRYTKRFWNNMSGEFSIFNLKNNLPKQDLSLSDKLQNIDIQNYIWVKFIYNWKSINIKTKNIIKIVTLITDEYWKYNFKPFELKSTYYNIIKNYKSELPESTFNKIKKIMEEFIESWWEIEFIEK